MDSQVLRRTTEDDGVLLAELVGEVDISNAFELGEALVAAVSNTTLGIVLDLTGATYLDSAGVHVLLRLHRRLRARRQQLRLVIPATSLIAEVLVFTGVPSVAPLHESVADAVAAMREAVALDDSGGPGGGEDQPAPDG